MRLEFKRTLDVKKYICYLKLSAQRDRLDIQIYLSNFEPNINDKVKKNVNKYLEKRGWIHKGSITQKGNEIISSGKIWDEEEGKYAIFCILFDQLLDSFPLRLERVAPERQERGNSQESDLSSLVNKPFNLNQGDYSNFIIKEIPINSLEQIPRDRATANLIWKIEDDETSTFEITNNYSLKGKTKPIDLNLLLEDLFKLNNSFGEWNKSKKKLMISFNKNKSGQMDSFNQNELPLVTSQFKFGNFNSAKIYNIPLMPKDKANAELWRNYLFEKDLTEEYKNQNEIKDISERICEREEFNDYNLDSSITTLKNSFSKIKKGNVFWHFFTPLDLDPRHISKSINTIDTFSIPPQSQISFMDIVDKLNISQSVILLKIFYYDLYVISEGQQKNFELLIQAILNKTNQKSISVELITLFRKKNSSESRSDYLKKSNPWIKETDVNTISNKKLNHGRYLILIGEQNQKIIWEISNSIDFITFSNQTTIDINTKGNTRDVSFQLHKDDSILYPDLKNYIQSIGVK